MKNNKKIKIAGGIAAAVVVLCAVIAVIFKFTGGKEDYRNISVFELTASATVTRDNTALDAYPGMKLMNGDNIKVGNGYICLLLDDDKYVTLEEGSEIRLNATGSSQNSKTTIELVRGAVLNELDSKLNADSSYELSTPVSVMAVRGTVFRAALSTDGEAGSIDLIVLDGQVAASDVLADGTVSSKANLVDAGKGAHVEKTDAHSDPVFSSTDISYEDLPAETLARILEIYESGRISKLSISKDQLEKLYEQKQNQENNPAGEDASENEPSGSPDNTSSDSQGETDPDSSANGADDSQQPGQDDESDENSENNSGTSPNANTNTTANSDAKPAGKTAAANSSKPSGKKNSGKTETKPDTGKSTKPTSRPSTGKKQEPTAKPGTVSQATPPAVQPPKNENKTYTVTFKDSFGGTFGTQSIASGSRAQKPKLSPANGTNWYDSQGNVYDFNTVVTGDLTLYYR